MQNSNNIEAVSPAKVRLEKLTDGSVRVHAPAKINLNLLVGPVRADGYHPLDSLVARITFYDTIELTSRDDGQIRLDCQGADCGPVSKNLAFRAAKLLADNSVNDKCPGVDITLAKIIPSGKGLGGGSSDAAAVLWALNNLWGSNLPAERLAQLAAELGSDVPLFLGPAVLQMTGRGEIITPAQLQPFWAVLILPDIACPTGPVYSAFDKLDTPSVEPAEQLDLEKIAQLPPSAFRGQLVNQLTPAAVAITPALGELLEQLQAAIDEPVHLTGSGSAMFVLCDDESEAAAIRAQIDSDMPLTSLIVSQNPW